MGAAGPAGFRNPAHSEDRGRAPLRPRAQVPVVTQRFKGALVSVYQWECDGHESAQPADEWSDAYEVVVPRRGAFLWEVEGERVFADPGVATFLHAAEAYRVRHPVPGGDRGSVFRLGPEVLAGLVADYDPDSAGRGRIRFPRRRVPLDGAAYLRHRLAIQAMATGSPPLEIEERAIEFLEGGLAEVYREHRLPKRRRNSGRLAMERAMRVAEIVAARYRERLTLLEVARAVGGSPFHLSRQVRAALGVPIHRMILRRRLRDALEQLLETRESIAWIAHEAGFASHSHLSDAFRAEYGISPRAVRRAAGHQLGRHVRVRGGG